MSSRIKIIEEDQAIEEATCRAKRDRVDYSVIEFRRQDMTKRFTIYRSGSNETARVYNTLKEGETAIYLGTYYYQYGGFVAARPSHKEASQ